MVFNSPEYFGFLFIAVVLFYLVPSRYKKALLLLAGYVFIGFYNLSSLAVLVLFTTINFYYADFLRDKKGTNQGSRYLWGGILLNIAALLLFKYFERTDLGLEYNISAVNFNLDALLVAVGFSFYTLQNIAYLIDVYHRRIKQKASWLDYAVFVGFFAKIPMGPIVLAQDFLPQLDKLDQKPKDSNLIAGGQRIILGLFKKMVIADRLAPSVTSVFDHADTNIGLCALLATYIFVIQLYFDFSGSMDIALGSARLFGIKLKENFNLPLRSTSISDFWRKWHMTLIQWLTKYLFNPLAFNLRQWRKQGIALGILIIFVLSGLWHGIGWTFFLYALCHAIYMIYELYTKKQRLRLSKKIPRFIYRPLSIFVVFNLVSFSFIFFRASSMSHLGKMLNELFTGQFWPSNFTAQILAPLAEGGELEPLWNLYFTIILTVLTLFFEKTLNRLGMSEHLNTLFIFCLIMLIFVFGIFDAGSRFIYVQF